MRPDPGFDHLEKIMGEVGADRRALFGWELRERGLLLAWDRAERSGPMSEVDRAMFILERLYPEMPKAHQTSIRRQFEARHSAGTWHGFRRPAGNDARVPRCAPSSC